MVKLKEMGTIYANIKRFGSKLRAFLPSRIPTEKAAFEAWLVSTLDLFGIEDTPVYRNAVVTLIMHMGDTQNHKSKYKIAKALRRAKLQETAYLHLEALRAEEKKKKEAQNTVAAPTLVKVTEPAIEQEAQG